MAPVLAVAGVKDGAVVVTDVLAKEKVGSVGQYDVVFGEAFLHHGLRRSNDNETGTEPEREDFAVFLRQLSESAVERLLELQEVSYYRTREGLVLAGKKRKLSKEIEDLKRELTRKEEDFSKDTNSFKEDVARAYHVGFEATLERAIVVHPAI
ncbi:hypothetical protein ACSQ67_008637 [Phaseolus vulgaris]